MRQKVDVIVDLQYGSTGKGLIAGYMATHGTYDTVVNANMPNAGHTFIDAKGQTMMHKVLPNGVVGKSVKNVMIGAGSIFDVHVLDKELHQLDVFGYDNFNLWIHEDAVVLTDKHRHAEQTDDGLHGIGSTRQGTSAAMIQKIMRHSPQSGLSNPTAGRILHNHPVHAPSLVTQQEWLALLGLADEILLEGAQGYSLGINAGFYPFCTSRDCTPARFMSDCGIPLPWLRRVVGTCRMHPIRVGGNSGGFYSDQEETSWEALGVAKEYTTVTGRERRVFTWSQLQIEEAIMACQPDHIFLNFCNYDPEEVDKTKGKIRLAGFKAGCSADIRYTGWGATVNDVRAGLLNPCDMTHKEINEGAA